MAIGTISTVKGADTIFGNKRVKVRDIQITAGANYTTGGVPLAASDVGLKKIDVVFPGHAKDSNGAHNVSLSYDYTNSKLQAYFSANAAANAEVGANTDLSTYTARVIFIGY